MDWTLKWHSGGKVGYGGRSGFNGLYIRMLPAASHNNSLSLSLSLLSLSLSLFLSLCMIYLSTVKGRIFFQSGGIFGLDFVN
jgi:hypothetical protein